MELSGTVLNIKTKEDVARMLLELENHAKISTIPARREVFERERKLYKRLNLELLEYCKNTPYMNNRMYDNLYDAKDERGLGDEIVYIYDAGIYVVVGQEEICHLCSIISMKSERTRLQHIIFGEKPHRFMILTSLNRNIIVDRLVSFFRDVVGDRAFSKNDICSSQSAIGKEQSADVIQVDQLHDKKGNKILFGKFKQYFDDLDCADDKENISLYSKRVMKINLFTHEVERACDDARYDKRQEYIDKGLDPLLVDLIREELEMNVLRMMTQVCKMATPINNILITNPVISQGGSININQASPGAEICGTKTEKSALVLEKERIAKAFVASNSPVGKTASNYRSEYQGEVKSSSSRLSKTDFKRLLVKMGYKLERKNNHAGTWKMKCDSCDNIITSTKPKKKRSKGEQQIGRYLTDQRVAYNEERTFPDCIHKKQLRFDFYLPRYNACIEFDGAQHFRPVPLFGGVEGLKVTQIRDKIKTDYCATNNIPLLRIPFIESNVEKKLKEFLRRIRNMKKHI